MKEVNSNPFAAESELLLGDEFLSHGRVVVPVEEHDALRKIRDSVANFAADHLGEASPEDPDSYLNNIGKKVSPENLNNLRLFVYNAINSEIWFRPAYYSLVRSALAAIVGNELVMQRRVNLSVQLPDDNSSLLPLHADVWSGDSAFEVVAWLPLVDCHRTKSMFLLPPEEDRVVQRTMASFGRRSVEDLFEDIEPKVEWIDINFGSCLLFTQNQIHGNRVNRELETRWSMNCRFKSLFSPYADKRLDEFFDPITVRPATRIGMDYVLPKGFEE